MTNTTSQNDKQTRIAIVQDRLHAAELAWNWCRANGRKASAASHAISQALTELKSLTK